MRRIYIWLLSLHPAEFRDHFANEMLGIFDAERRPVSLLIDGLVSLLRQRLLRPGSEKPAATVPEGYLPIETSQPLATILLRGSLASLILFFGAGLAMNRSGGWPRQFLIGVHHAGPSLLPLDRSSFAETELDTQVQFGSEPGNPWLLLAEKYFQSMRVLKALDGNQDLEISHIEILTAPLALRRLDTNGDGSLSAQECAVFKMVFHPVLRAFDSDGDERISALEMAASRTALQQLDANRDGRLSPGELLPDDAMNQAVALLTRPGPASEFIKAADRNGDGVTSIEELAEKLRTVRGRQRLLDAAKAR